MTLVDVNAINLGASTVTGNYSVTVTAGDISNSGALVVTGNSTFTANAAGANIDLVNLNNNFSGTVAFGGTGGLANVAIFDLSGLDLGALTLTGNLSVDAALGITQSGDLSIGGTTDLGANIASNILLNRAGNNFVGGVFVTSGNNVTLVDANTLDLAGGTVSGNLSLTSNGAITDSGGLAVTGTTTLAAGAANDITLDSVGNNFVNAVGIISGRNVTLVDANAIDLGPTSTVSGNLSVTANGAISDSGSLVVTGTTTLATGAANNITLDNGLNNFGGAVSITSGNNVTLVNADGIDLGASNVSGNFSVTTGGAVTDSGNLIIGGTTTVTAP